MNEQISWHVELIVSPGRLDDFRALTREMVESTRAEPGALAFERYIGEDKRVVHVDERYADSAAAVSHLLTFKNQFGRRFEGMVERRRFHVYGSPTSELKSLLDGYGATYFEFLDGFSR